MVKIEQFSVYEKIIMIIKHLHPEEAQKIAAGEVVERPANIIKELIENALDAGATKITLSVEDGGKKSITIMDNGNGMEEEDARICFFRHTTSKLTTFDDLQNLTTFGFRGEALASICSVAQVTITTRNLKNDHGIKLTLEYGLPTQEESVGAPIGTTIVINNLFDNLPARKKFLKSTTTEFNQIIQLFKAFCLSNLPLHFLLLNNTISTYSCPPVTTTDERVAQLFEISLSKQLFTLSQSQHTTATNCSGVITGPHYSRYDRNGMFIFVNKRWIKNFNLSQAIMKGYMKLLPAGKYPVAVIHISVPPTEVDINSHPKKEEVVFLHPRTIETMVSSTITATLEGNISSQLKQSSTSSFTTPSYTERPFKDYSFDPFKPIFNSVSTTYDNSFYSKPIQLIQPAENNSLEVETFPQGESATPNLFGNSAQPVTTETFQENYIEESLASYTILGQLHLTYILLEHPDGLLLVDQHAAHERILYEQLKTTFTEPETITLMFPETVSLQKDSIEELLEYLPVLENYGIKLEQMAPSEFIIRAKPAFAQSININELLQQIVGWIRESAKAEKESILKFITEKMRAQIACKAAIKAGDPLPSEKMHALLEQLNKTSNRFSCPHGRPTTWLIALIDIEKKFKRKL